MAAVASPARNTFDDFLEREEQRICSVSPPPAVWTTANPP